MFEIVGMLSTFIMLLLLSIVILLVVFYGSSINNNRSVFSKGTGITEKLMGIVLLAFIYGLWYLFFS